MHASPYKGLDQLCNRLQHLETVYAQEKHLNVHLSALRSEVHTLREQFQSTYHITPLRRIGIGLGLAFLSTCTVRYWLNKFEAAPAPYTITIRQEARASDDIEQILRRADGIR